MVSHEEEFGELGKEEKQVETEAEKLEDSKGK